MTVPTDWTEVPPPGPEAVGPTAAGLEARIATPTSSAVRPAGRPAPQYGEYAPEGWVNPVLAEAERREREEAARQCDAAAAPTTTPGPWRTQGGPPDRAEAAAVRRRPRDVIFTVVLFAIGLVTVVQGFDATSVAANIATTIGNQYTPLDHPHALVTAAAWCAVGQAVLFVAAAWWAVVRIRRAKTSFWIPLVAGIASTAASGFVYFIVVMQDPAFSAWFAAHN